MFALKPSNRRKIILNYSRFGRKSLQNFMLIKINIYISKRFRKYF